jgi:prolyl oligopeptidase
MRPMLFVLVIASFAAPALPAQADDTMKAPPTPQHAASTNLHGIDVADPYRWLENPDDPAVQAWIAAQNAHTETVLGQATLGQALTARVQALSITSTTRSGPELVNGTLFYQQQTPPQPQPMLMAQTWPDGEAKTLVDPNADGGKTAITAYWPSPSGRYLAYGTAEGGAELTTIRFLDVRTGTPLPDALPWAGDGTTPQDLAWDADEHGVTYVRFASPARGKAVEQFDTTLAHHALGADAQNDPVVFGAGYSHVAEYTLLSSPDARRLAILAFEGDGGAAEVFLRSGGEFKRVLGREANVRSAQWMGDRLHAVSFADAPRGRIVSIDDSGATRTVLDQRDGAIQQLAPFGDGFLVVRSAGPDWWAEQYSGDARLVRRLPLPDHGIAIGGIASESGQDKALVAWSGWNTPTRWSEYDGASGQLATVFEVKPAADYSQVRTARIEGISKDGTHIPVTVLSLPGNDADGKRPTILYSYGGFGIPVTPSFIGANLVWLEHGGVLAYANIRGGNEFGEAWHAQGQKRDKQNVFDDFHAAAMALVEHGWTDRDHLGILGGSNGGLLMGAQIVQFPRDYRAVAGMVGIYDVPRHETAFANGPYNVSEYGSVADAAQSRATLAYSPLHNVQAETAYPAMLLTTGANDPRVAPWQSRKFAAALQSATTSGRPILLLTRMDAGHGIGAPFSQRVGNTALTLTFFADQLGMESPQP